MKTINFPFAGGNKYSFNKIFGIDSYHHTIEVNRQQHQFDISALLEGHVFRTVQLSVGEEFIIYGHSMGALIGYLVCQKLQELNLPMPTKLVVSGKKPPSIFNSRNISDLPDDIFWDQILTLGGIPDEIKSYPEFIDYFLPILRYDLRLLESYQYEKKSKLNIPIDVFYGSEEATKEEMQGWKDETTANVNITQMEGNHFFIFDHVGFFTNYFNNLTKSQNL